MSKFNCIEYCENIQPNSQKPHFYKITNLINNKYYWGVHDGSNTENYQGSGLLLQQAYEKHGIQNFKKQILKEFEIETEAYELEAVIVDEAMINKNNPMCYNLCIGGKGGDKYSCQTPERQAEISKKLSEAHKGENHPMFGKNHSHESKDKIIQGLKNYWDNMSDDDKKQQSEKRKEIQNNISDEKRLEMIQKQKNTWANKTEEEMEEISRNMSNAGKGRPKTDKWKEEMSKFWKGKTNNPEMNNIMYKCPYDNKITNAGCMSQYIKRHYPNEKQWKQFSKVERQSFKIN